MLKERIELNTGLQLNSLLANLYRDGHDHVSWHCDDEPALGDQPIIASLSFGDTRNFELRKKSTLLENDGNVVYTEYVKVPLDAGTLLIMEGAIQNDWQHRVPREYHDRGPRVNLTFRVIFPEPANIGTR
jgi:alpha-ketoglutarate-dependent dioxygenase alkB family protein 3